MSPDPLQESSHPDELLPWYVNHTLSPQEQEAVDGHLQNCSHCQKEIEFLENMRGQVQAIPFESPGELGLQRLLTEVKKDKEAKQPHQLTPPQTWWKTFAIAASFIIVAQAGLLMDAYFFSKPMVPLSGPQREGIVLQVSFVPTATEAEIRKKLNAIHGTVIDGPGLLGIYRIRLNIQPTHQKDIDEAIAFLQQQTTIIGHVAKE